MHFSSLPLRRWALLALSHLPHVILYLSCFSLFYLYVSELTLSFFQFKTNVLIRYDSPQRVTFPGLTICGCSYSHPICTNRFWEVILPETEALEEAYSAVDIIANHSFAEGDLVTSCHLVYDSRRPDFRTPCSEITPPVVSLQNGRKCFTYFSQLNEHFRRHSWNYHLEHETRTDRWEDMRTTDQNTWLIQLQVNFTEMEIPLAFNSEPDPDMSRLADADIILALHAPNMIPTELDVEFQSIDACASYSLHFTKQITRLQERPYNPHCNCFRTDTPPRSANECTHMCLLKGLRKQQDCLNAHSVLTTPLLSWLQGFDREPLRFCNGTGAFPAYQSYVAARRRCLDPCGRDCAEEQYSVVAEESALCSDGAGVWYSQVSIKPDRKLHEVIQHSPEMDFYQWVGCLGGHSHLWLGLSAIQLYDVAARLVGRLKWLWRRFVECG